MFAKLSALAFFLAGVSADIVVPDQGNWGTVVSIKFPTDSNYPSNGVLYLSGVTVQRTYAIDYYFTVQQESMVVLPYVADLGQQYQFGLNVSTWLISLAIPQQPSGSTI
ncbi:hypothetical protein HD554DRAFT_2038801 [Boletus coccyginus]|nr:hypothetical protein HD554DRAFT_2038801 [Boletus coccyginus]